MSVLGLRMLSFGMTANWECRLDLLSVQIGEAYCWDYGLKHWTVGVKPVAAFKSCTALRA